MEIPSIVLFFILQCSHRQNRRRIREDERGRGVSKTESSEEEIIRNEDMYFFKGGKLFINSNRLINNAINLERSIN